MEARGGETPASESRRPPDVLGWRLERARPRLEAAGYAVGVLETRPPVPPAAPKDPRSAGSPPRRPPRPGLVAAGPWRVVAVRPARQAGEVTLVVAREVLGPQPESPSNPPAAAPRDGAGSPGSLVEGDGEHG